MIINDFPNEILEFPSENVIAWPSRSSRRLVKFSRAQERVFLALSPWFGVDSSELKLKLFGCKYSLAGAILDGSLLPQDYFGFVSAYYLIGNDGSLRELIQRGTVIYCEHFEENDFVVVDGFQDGSSTLPGLDNVKWKIKDAIWPKCNDRPMRFLMQFHLSSTEKIKKYFFPNKNIYLFSGCGAHGNEFKAVIQEARYQTAERHYAKEVKKIKPTKD